MSNSLIEQTELKENDSKSNDYDKIVNKRTRPNIFEKEEEVSKEPERKFICMKRLLNYRPNILMGILLQLMFGLASML